MKKRRLKILVVLFSFLFLLKVNAQDPMFSQFYAIPLYLAPSYAGATSKGTRMALNYRNQWPGINSVYNTYNFSFDHYFPKINSGVGLFMLNDVAGSANLYNMALGMMYSFDFKVTDVWHIRPGVGFSYLRSGIDFSQLRFYSDLDANTEYPDYFNVYYSDKVERTTNDFDVSTSVMAYNANLWFGMSVNHLMRPDVYFFSGNPVRETGQFSYMRSLKFSFFGGARMKLRGNLLKYYKESLTFAYLFETQYSFEQLSFGVYYHKNPLVFGVWYRGIPIGQKVDEQYVNGNESIVFLAGYKISDIINVGYSYDFTVSELNTSISGGAHEISFIWGFHIKQKRKKPTSLPCPEF